MDTTHMMPVEVSFTPEDGIWIGQCDTLGVMTQGQTFAEVQENLREALLLFVESCIRRGVLQQVLEEAGLEPVQIEAVREYSGAHTPCNVALSSPCHA